MRNTVLHLQPSASAEHVKVLPTESCEWYCTRICRFVALKDTLRIASSHLGIYFSRWWSTKTLPVILGQNTFSSIIMVENGCVTIRHWRCFPMGAMEGFGSFWMIFQSISYCFRYKLEGWSQIASVKVIFGRFWAPQFLEDFSFPKSPFAISPTGGTSSINLSEADPRSLIARDTHWTWSWSGPKLRRFVTWTCLGGGYFTPGL